MADATVAVPTRILSRAELAAAGFLARYTGHTLEAYNTDLRILFEWCAAHGLDILDDVTRPHLELFGRHLEYERHNSVASVLRRLSTVRCFYRCCAIDGIIPKSPAEYLRMPRLFVDDTKKVGLDRIELGSLIATARASTLTESALITLMGLLGLRVSEACSVRVEDFAGTERGHRVLTLVGKGGKPATMPLPIPVARTLDACAGGRTAGPLLLRRDGTPMTRKSAALVVTRLTKKAGIGKHVTPHVLRHSYVTACLDAGVPLRDVQIAARHSDPRQTMRYDRARRNFDRHANYIVAGFIAGAA